MAETTIEKIESSKIYSSGVHALDSLNLSVKSGESLYHLTPYGAGRVTTTQIFLNLLHSLNSDFNDDKFCVLPSYPFFTQRIRLFLDIK